MSYREAAIGALPAPPRRIVAGAEHLFPREHPSADLCLVVAAIALLGAGPIAGVPGVLLAQLVASETQPTRELFTGALKAKVALVLAWTGSFLWLAFWMLLLGRASALVAYGATLTGVMTGCAGIPVVWVRGRSRYAITVVAVAAVTLAASGLGGAVWNSADAREAAANCSDLRQRAQQAVTAANFDQAGWHLRDAASICVDGPLGEARALAAQLPQLEAEHRRKEVSTRFQATRSVVDKALSEAKALSEGKKFEEAENKLAGALARLREFEKWPHVADSQSYKQTVKSLADERVRIAPAVDEALRTRIAAMLTEARGLSAAKKWDLALSKLRDADTVVRDWKPLPGTAAGWQRLTGEIESERERANSAAAAERRRRDEAAEAARKREEAAQDAKEASRRIQCCDGTLSPSCLCSRASRRGCCSHHGGVCGCE